MREILLHGAGEPNSGGGWRFAGGGSDLRDCRRILLERGVPNTGSDINFELKGGGVAVIGRQHKEGPLHSYVIERGPIEPDKPVLGGAIRAIWRVLDWVERKREGIK